MLVSKSNGFNASAVLGSGSYNENKSSKYMELLGKVRISGEILLG